MVVRRRIASAYEDGAKKRLKQYGTIIGVFLVVMYVLTSGSNENEAIDDIKPLRSKSKINSFSGPYEQRPNQQQHPNQQMPPYSQQPPPMDHQGHQHQQMHEPPPPMGKESIDDSVRGAQHELEVIGHKEAMKSQEELLEKTLQAASDSLRQHPINNEDVDPKNIENAIALRLEEEASVKLQNVADSLIEEKESALNQIVDEDKAEGLKEEEIIEDVSLIEEMSIKELKQEISDEVQVIEKGLQEEANKIESQVLKETLDRIQKQKELDEATSSNEQLQVKEEAEIVDEDSEKEVEVIDENEPAEETAKNEDDKSDKIISLVENEGDGKEEIIESDESEVKEEKVVNEEKINGETIFNKEEKNEETIDENHEQEEKIIDLNIKDKDDKEIADEKNEESEQKEKIIDLNLEDKNDEKKSDEED